LKLKEKVSKLEGKMKLTTTEIKQILKWKQKNFKKAFSFWIFCFLHH